MLTALVLWIGFVLLGAPHARIAGRARRHGPACPWLGVLLTVLPLLLVALISDPVAGFIGAAYALAVALVFEFKVQPRYFPRIRPLSLLLLIVAMVLALEAGLAGLILAPAVTVAVQASRIHLVESPRRGAAGANTCPPADTGLSHLRETISRIPSYTVAAEVSSLVNRLDGLIAASKEL